ncbi:transmembrane protein 9B-like isoform X2 [Spodoptera litura]|uniref:Transmembrane protein 9B-like isoform X2 n=1 Tax=Spodoptera litura TaxID=69820 RepID=A0A9J7EL94_SPOLT|nr:transmembrane protein 9B-like isoform X2 [Spodoptera litura]
MDSKIIIILMSLVLVKAQFFEDRRCRCVCPSPAAVLNTSTTRQIYTGNVPPNLCNCEDVVFPFIREELEGKLYMFCPRCECVYQTRNTSLIMGVVSMIIILVMVLILYTIAIWSLKAVLRRRNRTVSRTPESTEQPDTTEQRTEETSLLLWDDPDN